MATTIHGYRNWSGQRDDKGYREYKLHTRVRSDNVNDGPAVVLQTPGLPQPGDIWAFGSDLDIWVWCLPTAEVKMVTADEPGLWWDVHQVFTNKLPDAQRCQDIPIEDPILEPAKVSGGYSKQTKEAVFDRFGYAITNSAWEQVKGKGVEVDYNHPTVTIEMNVADLQLGLFTSMVDTVSDRPLWGVPDGRMIKLSNAAWQRLFQGSCNEYFTWRFEFEINYDTWDKILMDEGTKCINGHWGTNKNGEGYNWVVDDIGGNPPDPMNPAHFIRYKDRQGEPIHGILDGLGKPVTIETIAANYFAYKVSIATGGQGSGYAVGDQLAVVGGTSSIVAILEVVEVRYESDDEGNPTNRGSIKTIQIIAAGKYSVRPTNPVSATAAGSSVGTGAKFNILWADYDNGPTLPGRILMSYYPESNFTLLGIPLVF